MTDKFSNISDYDLRCIIWAYDVLSLPLTRRFDGDDQALRDFVKNEMKLEPNLVNMHMCMLAVLRECTVRGLMVGYYE